MPAKYFIYGLMINSGATDPSEVHRFLEYAAKLTNKFRIKHTVVMADQALQASNVDDTGILLSCLGNFISLETLWAPLKTYAEQWR